MKSSAFLNCTGVAIIVIVGGLPFAVFAQKQDQKPPLVISASVPFYPTIALSARIQGTVKVRISTDGKKVSSVNVVSGPPLLVAEVRKNLSTWEFAEHQPRTFLVTFEYRMEEPSGCGVENGTAVLRMPLSVQISAKPVTICDPVAPRK